MMKNKAGSFARVLAFAGASLLLVACSSPSPLLIESCQWHYVGLHGDRFSLAVKLRNVSTSPIEHADIWLYPIPGNAGASTPYDVSRRIEAGSIITFRITDNVPGGVRDWPHSKCDVGVVTFANGAVWRPPPAQMYP